MISILIPIYNFNVSKLVKDLVTQANILKLENYEVLISDDASLQQYRDINASLESYDVHVKYLQQDKNIGRSRIRNFLIRKSKNDFVVFMDADSEVVSDSYIKNYVDFCIPEKEIVVYGGRCYNNEKPADSKFMLHWTFGKYREEIPAQVRRLTTNKSFMTNNFLISKSVLNRFSFNESIRRYGHEDTLFGYELKKNNITITHIDNPLKHIGLESSEVFIAKTRTAIQNLKVIYNQNMGNKELTSDIQLLDFYIRVKNLKLLGLVKILFYLLEKVLLRNLTGKNPRLRLFDFYKLGYISSLPN